MCRELAVLFLILFLVETPSWTTNYENSGRRNACRSALREGAVEPPEVAAELLQECYGGKAVYGEMYHHLINQVLRYGQGMCEEYSSSTTSLLPVDVPDPFLPLSSSIFCRAGGGFSDWVGVLNFFIIMVFLMRWKRLPQVAAQVQDMMDYTPADFAVFVQGIQSAKHKHDEDATIWEQLQAEKMYVDDVKLVKDATLGKEVAVTLDKDDKEEESTIIRGLETKLSNDLNDLGFPVKGQEARGVQYAVEHIACGRDCGAEIAILRKLSALKQDLLVTEDAMKFKDDPEKLKAFKKEAGCVGGCYLGVKDCMTKVRGGERG